MLFLMFLLIFLKTQYAEGSSAGTVLFKERKYYPECWTVDQVAKLRARKILEGIIPPQVAPDKINRKYAKETLKYLRSAVKETNKSGDPYSTNILREAMADTIGSHLRKELLPSVKFAYYAGYIPYNDVHMFQDLYEDMKTMLNTNGIGWRPPARIPQQSNLTVGKILIGLGKLNDPCSCLVVKHADHCLRLPTPKLDDEHNPSAMVLPFKNGGLVSLYSPNSENILLEYYTTAARCILNSSPETCRHTDFVNFNNELWHWMKKSVAPHLMDEKLYPALGGVLRVAAAVQNYGKGLSRRNLIEDFEEDHPYRWYPWRTVSGTGVYINSDWTPQLYIGVVVLIACLMCCMQLCYDKICDRRRACCCIGRRPSSGTRKDVPYTSVDTNFPAMLPMHYVRSASAELKRKVSSLPKSKSASTIRTQRVYDLNENTEKIMSVIMSDNECTELEESTSASSEEDPLQKTVIDMRSSNVLHAPNSPKSQKSKSPPQIEAVVAQLQIDKPTCMDSSRMNVYLTDTATETTATFYRGRLSDTGWSESSSTSRSMTTASVKSHSSKLRDLAWARRVACKQRRRESCSRSNTGTEFNSYIGTNSFTTPPSRR